MSEGGLATEAIGGVAGLLSSLSLFPQVIKCWRRRSAADISHVWLVSGLVAVSLWVVYGFLIDGIAVIVANAVVGLCLVLIGIIKVRCGK